MKYARSFSVIIDRRSAIAAVIALLATLGVSLHSPAAEPDARTDEQRMAAWWEDLRKADPHSARALLNFAGRPEQAVAYFKERLEPLKISEEDLNKLLVELGSEDETVWKAAFEKLEYFDPRLTTELPKLMVEVTDPVARTRLVEILTGTSAGAYAGQRIGFRSIGAGEGYNFEINDGSIWAEAQVSRLASGTWENSKSKWTRAVRAIAVLEHVGTPEAIAILKNMSTGHPDAAPTKAALEALESLGATK